MTAVHSAPASERTEAPGVTALHSAAGSAATSTNVVEKALLAALDVLPEPVRTGCHRVVDAGGKRLRPDLVLRCADIGPLGATAALSAAVAVELLHSASLVHDDLLDDSDTRRGVLAVHRHEGMGTAVIAGDAMIALSWRTIAATGAENVDDLAAALAEMCEGQALEERLRFDPSASADDVLRVSELKTGALLKAACRIGARVGGCSDEQVRALGDFGSDFGVALQLMDDVLDLVADQAALGKPIGADFRAGTVTMPTVYCLETGGAGAALRLRSLLRPGVPAEALDEAGEIVLGSGSISRTVDLACVLARRAARSAAAAGAPAELVSMPERYVRRQIKTKVAAAHQGLLPRSQVDWENERVG
ncbi:polyprenyl synthetase family protein [Nakamurella sp. GG22]